LTLLAIHGGKPARTKAWPSWPVWDEQERTALERVLESGHWSQWDSEGRKVGSFGYLGCFSFSSSKLMTCGEGGTITTNDAKLARLCSAIVNRGTPW